MQKESGWVAWWLLIPVMLVVMAVSVANLDNDYIWIDELFSIGNIGWLTGQPYNPIEVIQSVATKSPAHPPAYFIILSVWAGLTGWSQFTLRAYSLLLGLLTMAVMYQCGRVWLPRRTGLYPAVVIGWGAYFIYYTHELRMYTQLALFVALTLWAYGRIVLQNRSTRLSWLLLFISTLGLIYTHYFGLLLAAGIGTCHLLTGAKNRRWLQVVVVMGSTVLLFLPWLRVVRSGISRANRFTDTALTPLGILQALLDLFSNGQVVFLLVLLVVSIASLFVFRRTSYRLWLIFMLTFTAVAIFSVIIPTLPPRRVRYLMIFWPLLALLVGLALELIQQLRGYRLAAVVLSVWLVLGISTFNDPEADPQTSGRLTSIYPPFDRIVAEMAPRMVANDLLFSFTHSIAYDVGKFTSIGEYYLRPLPGDYYVTGLWEHPLDEIEQQHVYALAQSHPTVWLISEPNRTADAADFYRETLTAGYTLCDVLVDDAKLRIERFDLNWFNCETRTLPAETLVQFGDDIGLKSVKLFSTADQQLKIASVWSVGELVPIHTYSVSFKLWNDGPEHVALVDFGLPFPSGGWTAASIPVNDLQAGPYRLTATVYNWKTGERLNGVYGDATGSEISFIEFQLPFEGTVNGGS